MISATADDLLNFIDAGDVPKSVQLTEGECMAIMFLMSFALQRSSEPQLRFAIGMLARKLGYEVQDLTTSRTTH